jgi:hypothetical protein
METGAGERRASGAGGADPGAGRTLRLCLDKLHPDYREALYLTYFEGLSQDEAAAVMGKSEKQIKNLVFRGKQALRRCWKARGSPMRSTSERTAAIEKRTGGAAAKEKRRRGSSAGLSAAACLALIVGPRWRCRAYGAAERRMGGGSGAAASVFAASGAAGYVLIGLLAFALGCCVTILCYRLRRRNREEHDGRDR